MWVFAFAALTYLACAQNVSYQYADLGFNAPIGSQFLYQLIPPYPSLGSLWFKGSLLESPYLFNSTADLRYAPNDSFVFQTLDPQTSVAYDRFYILVTVVTQTDIITVNSSVNVTLYDAAVDMFDNTTYVHSSPGLERVQFSIRNRQKGLVDNQVSRFAFYNPDNTSQVYQGLVFNTTCNPVSCLKNEAGVQLSEGVLYARDDVYSSLQGNGSGEFRVDLYGRNGTLVDSAYLIIRTFDATVASSLSVVSIEGVNATFSPSINLTEDGATSFRLRVDSVPIYGTVSQGDTTLAVGSELVYPTSIIFTPQSGYFNQFLFPNGSVSVNYSDGTAIWDTCSTDTTCTTDLVFTLVSLAGTQTFGPQRVKFTVQRPISEDVLYACPLCTVRSGAAFYLTVDDGRERPEPMIRFISVPSNGTLSNFGTNITVGTVINFRDMELLYTPDQGYFNRFLYNSAPNETLSIVDDLDNAPPSSTLDSFQFEVFSAFFDYLAPQTGTVEVIVAYESETILTACPVNATNATTAWEESCIAFGLESNSIYGEYATPIVLTVGGVNSDETVLFTISTVPLYGDLYINEGTFEDPVFGSRRLLPGNVVNTSNLVYSGRDNYANQLASQYTNLLGEPFGGCGYVTDQGCPDSFTFFATTNTTRTSQVATYLVYIVALPSEAVIEVAENYITSLTTFNVPFRYTDVDNGESWVMVQILSYEMAFGTVGVNISYLPECMPILNCTESYNIPMIDKHVASFLSSIYVVPIQNSSLDDENSIAVVVYKRPEVGIDPDALFTPNDTDHIYAADTIIYTSDINPVDDYYFAGCEDDECLEHYKNDAALIEAEHNQRLIYIIGGSVGGAVALVLLAIGLYLYNKRPPEPERREPKRLCVIS